MNRFAKMTLAAAALSLTALSAVPASAADVVVSLRGKTADQVNAEIQVAAVKICREANRAPLAQLLACTNDVTEDAISRLPASLR